MATSTVQTYAVCDADGVVDLTTDWPKGAPVARGMLSFARGDEAELRTFLLRHATLIDGGKFVIPDVANESDQIDAYGAFLDWLEGLRGKGYDHLLIKPPPTLKTGVTRCQ